MAEHERVRIVDIGIYTITDQSDGVAGAVHQALAASLGCRELTLPEVAFLALGTRRQDALDDPQKMLVVVEQDDILGADTEPLDNVLTVRKGNQ